MMIPCEHVFLTGLLSIKNLQIDNLRFSSDRFRFGCHRSGVLFSGGFCAPEILSAAQFDLREFRGKDMASWEILTSLLARSDSCCVAT